jgi:hypothetical protein
VQGISATSSVSSWRPCLTKLCARLSITRRVGRLGVPQIGQAGIRDGGQTLIGDVEFAHGGTEFLVSRRAFKMVVAEYVGNKSEWEAFTSGHWAGDCVLGKTFRDAGAPLAAAWPIWQGDEVGDMNYDRVDGGERRQWCGPTVSYHHLGTAAIGDLWEFEQRSISEAGKVSTSFRLCSRTTELTSTTTDRPRTFPPPQRRLRLLHPPPNNTSPLQLGQSQRQGTSFVALLFAGILQHALREVDFLSPVGFLC